MHVLSLARYLRGVREEARYVLHLWRDGRGDDAWRASLTDVRTRAVRRFGGMAALRAFLDERTARQTIARDRGAPTEGPPDVDDDEP